MRGVISMVYKLSIAMFLVPELGQCTKEREGKNKTQRKKKIKS